MTASTWPRVRLKELGKWFGGGTPSKSNPGFWTDGNIPWLSPKDMGLEVLAGTQDHITKDAVENSSVKRVPAGSVALVVRSGILERTLPVAVVPFDTTLNQDMKAVVARPGIDARWIAWGLRGSEQELLRTCRKAGTTVASMEMPRLYEHTIPVPPLDEQLRIVDILEEHLSRLDAGKSYLASAIAKTDAMHRGVLQTSMRGELMPIGVTEYSRDHQLSTRRALCPANMKRGRPEPSARVQDLDRCPDTWTQVSLEEATHPVRTISYGILKPGPNLGQGVPYVRVLNMRDDTLRLDDLHRTSDEIASQYARASLVSGDVLVSIRGTYGRVVPVPEALTGGNITQDTARLAFVGPIDPSFACLYLRSPGAQAYLKRVARGVAVKGVNIGDLRTMPFPIPPIEEQLQIVAKVDELTSELDDARITAESGLSRAAILRHSLLQAAFSGRLTGGVTDMEMVEEMAGV